jgi:hypothetical protein
MSAQIQTAAEQAEQLRCWCCGQARDEDGLVRLGNHPEVGICLNCVHFLRRKALDREATVLRQRLRGTADTVRREVMARGWRQRPVTGTALRWLNRHLPW